MRFLAIPILISLLFFASCGEEGSPSTELLKIEVDSDYVAEYQKLIIIAYNDDGELLGQVEGKASTTTSLKSATSLPGEKIVIVKILITTATSFKYYFVELYTDIDPGSTWKLRTIPGNPPSTTTGSVVANMSSSISQVDFRITDKYGNSLNDNDIAGKFAGDIHADKLNVMYRPYNGALKHKMLTGLKNKDVINLAASDMVEYDTKVTMSFPGTPIIAFQSYGYEADWKYPNYGYTIDFHTAFNQSTITTGYPSSLVQYATVVSFFNEARSSVTYLKVGSVPTSNITWPDPSKYSVQNKSITDFLATTDKPIAYRITSYYRSDAGSSTATSWQIITPSLTQKIPTLPAELMAEHPGLSSSNMDYHSTRFTISGETYQQYLDSQFSGIDPSELERIGVVVN